LSVVFPRKRKHSYGVTQLRDLDAESYWQSDGPQPHFLTIHFRRRTTVEVIELCLDAPTDESYTPRKIAIRTGTCPDDLTERRRIVLQNQNGLVRIALCPSKADVERYAALPADQQTPGVLTVPLHTPGNLPHMWPNGDPIAISCFQLVVLENNQNGRDTHLRQIRIFGPRTPNAALPAELGRRGAGFKTVPMLMYTTLR
jgi:anaphase-promoting complex subunit 10